MSNKSVPKLEHLAFMASYKDIFNNLSLICDYESKNFDGDEDDSLENETSFTSLYETINCVRYHLSQHLIGTMNDTTRYKTSSIFQYIQITCLLLYFTVHLSTYYRKMYVQKLYEALREFKNEAMYIGGSRYNSNDLN